jgi:pimeloyl-ACP methyl ester carboxylesterase
MTVRFAGEGVGLAADVDGDWSGPPAVLLHGGGQTRHAWGATSRVLADAGFLAVRVDRRGHGESDWAGDGDYGIDAYARDVRAIARQIARPVALVGASLGGLAALVALAEPPCVDATAVVLVDVTPRMRQDGRERIGEFMRSRPDGFASVEEAADAVSRYLPGRPRPKDISGLARNLRLGADGRFRWHWDPRFLDSRLQADTGHPTRFEDAAARVTVPMLLVRGGESDVVGEDEADALLRVAPRAQAVDVAGAGHMVAGDRNDIFTAAVVEFLVKNVRAEQATSDCIRPDGPGKQMEDPSRR